jgi:hypothetical protein
MHKTLSSEPESNTNTILYNIIDRQQHNPNTGHSPIAELQTRLIYNSLSNIECSIKMRRVSLSMESSNIFPHGIVHVKISRKTNVKNLSKTTIKKT